MITSFETVRHDIDERLASYLKKLADSITTNTSVEYVQAAAAYIQKLAVGGKRVRGYVLVAMYQTAGGKQYDEIMNAALAIELFHLFALIQDDIMDRAATRRGVATLHVFTEKWLQTHKRHGDLAHTGDSQAILWGDFLLALSQSKLQSAGFTGKKLTQALAVFSRMFTEVVVGQMIDVDMVTRPQSSAKELEEKNRLKSALYSFVRPMQIGASLAGATKDYLKMSEVYGTNLGMAFQIQDDLFDLTLSENALQKPVLNDIAAGAHTLFSNYVWEHGTEAQKSVLKRAFGASISVEEVAAVRQIFHDSGAISYGKKVMTSYFKAAETSLTTLPTAKQQPWRDLIAIVRNRES